MKKAGIITFPGSNCDRDMYVALQKHFSETVKIWYKDSHIDSDIELLVIPGGFSYGDYLRCGAIAANSSIMKKIKKFANNGGYVLGVCNGFQILTESGLLKGTLLRNKSLKFISKLVNLEVVNKDSKFTHKYKKSKISIPIAHHDGNYFCDSKTLKELEDNQQIAFKYVDNPNGSILNIAGIFNKEKNILGMMPHPERAIEDILYGGTDGNLLFESISYAQPVVR